MVNQISLEDILKRMKSKLVKMAIIVASILVLITAYILIMPQTFTSYATVMPPESSSGGGLSSFLANVGSVIDLGAGRADNKSLVMKSVLQSRSVAEKVNSKLNLKENPTFKKLKDKDIIKIIPNIIFPEIDKSGIITVSASIATGYLPNEKEKENAAKLSSDIANAAIESLNEVLIEKNNSSAKKSRMYVESEIVKYEKQLDSVSKELEKFQMENKVLALEEQTQAIVSQAIELNTELTEMKTKLNLAKIQYSANSPQVESYEKQVAFLQEQSLELQRGNTGDEFAIPLSQVPSLTREYLELFRDKKIITNVISYLETQKHQEAIQEEKNIPIVEVLDKAITPEQRSSPKRAMILIVSVFITTISVVGVFILLTYIEIRKDIAKY